MSLVAKHLQPRQFRIPHIKARQQRDNCTVDKLNVGGNVVVYLNINGLTLQCRIF